jgi:hypothetical protein
MADGAFVSVVDVPDLAPFGREEPTTSTITLARLGSYKHPRHGKFRVTKRIFESFIKNFARRGRLAVDFDHSPEKKLGDRPTEAAGWITGLKIDGPELKADVEWTDLGTEAVRSKRYLFISPTWALRYEDQHGDRVGPTLIGAGLTNRPFFDLPTLSFSREIDPDPEVYVTADADHDEDEYYDDDYPSAGAPAYDEGRLEADRRIRTHMELHGLTYLEAFDQLAGELGDDAPGPGFDLERQALDDRVQMYMRGHDCDYTAAFDAVAGEDF